MKKQHYVNNKQFYEAILEYKRQVKESEEKELDKPRIPNYIGECIYKIAVKLSTKPCFYGYSYKDEMIKKLTHIISKLENEGHQVLDHAKAQKKSLLEMK